MVPMLDNLSYAMTTSNTYFKKAPELKHDIDQEWFHDNFSNIIELTRQIQNEETGKTRTDSDEVKSHEYLVTIPEGSGGFIWELLGRQTLGVVRQSPPQNMLSRTAGRELIGFVSFQIINTISVI